MKVFTMFVKRGGKINTEVALFPQDLKLLHKENSQVHSINIHLIE